MAKDTVVDLTQKALAQDIKVLQRLFEQDFVPLIKQRQQLEREAFDKAYDEVQRAEAEVQIE